jgi:hypothetical protein
MGNIAHFPGFSRGTPGVSENVLRRSLKRCPHASETKFAIVHFDVHVACDRLFLTPRGPPKKARPLARVLGFLVVNRIGTGSVAARGTAVASGFFQPLSFPEAFDGFIHLVKVLV